MNKERISIFGKPYYIVRLRDVPAAYWLSAKSCYIANDPAHFSAIPAENLRGAASREWIRGGGYHDPSRQNADNRDDYIVYTVIPLWAFQADVNECGEYSL